MAMERLHTLQAGWAEAMVAIKGRGWFTLREREVVVRFGDPAAGRSNLGLRQVA